MKIDLILMEGTYLRREMMETFTYQRILPSCTLNRSLLAEIEKRLLFGVPRLLHHGLKRVLQGLGIDDHRKLENYEVIIDTGKGPRTLKSAGELAFSYFEPGTRQVNVVYRLGAPKMITVEIVFSQNGRSQIDLSTHSPQIGKILPRIAEGVCAAIQLYGNRHRVFHNSFVQTGLLFATPALVMAYGFYREVDFFLLYACMGWLCLLSLGVIMSLPRMFPWVTFESRHRFQLRRLPLLARFALLTVAIGCYIGLVLLSVPSTDGQGAFLLAGVVG
jgi:hypothetical protein